MNDHPNRSAGAPRPAALAVLLSCTAIVLAAAALGFRLEVPRDPLLADALPRALAMGGLASLCAALRF